jgi:hypothetical protein
MTAASHRSCRHHEPAALAGIDAGETLADIAPTYGVDATTIGRLKN